MTIVIVMYIIVISVIHHSVIVLSHKVRGVNVFNGAPAYIMSIALIIVESVILSQSTVNLQVMWMLLLLMYIVVSYVNFVEGWDIL